MAPLPPSLEPPEPPEPPEPAKALRSETRRELLQPAPMDSPPDASTRSPSSVQCSREEDYSQQQQQEEEEA